MAQVAHATDVSNRYATRLMANPGVGGIAAGSSADAPGEPAIMLYVNGNVPRRSVPVEVEGVRTRIMRAASVQPGTAMSPVAEEELARVAAVKSSRARELMRNNGAIFGVGVGASDDNPGEAALVLFVDQDKNYTAPASLDGARVKVYRADRFRAWGWNETQQRPQSCAPPQTTKLAGTAALTGQ